MEALEQVMRQMIEVSDEELTAFLSRAITRNFKRNEIISRPNVVPNEIFFIEQGLIRVVIADAAGEEHTVHFAIENQFIADYAQFLTKQPAIYSLQCLEATRVVVLPRAAIDWAYENMREGQKMGRLIAEFYFIYQDNRINNSLARTPKEALRQNHRSISEHS